MILAVRSKGGQTDEETAAITFSESFTTFYGTLYIIGHQGLYASTLRLPQWGKWYHRGIYLWGFMKP